MPIYHHHQAIFVHIPKTGGTSIEHYFGRKFQWPTLYTKELFGPYKGRMLQHLTCKEIQTSGFIDELRFSRFLKFAIIRDPYERMTSLYRYYTEHRPDESLSFSRFMTYCIREGNFDRQQLTPQFDFVHDADGCLMVDQLIRFDRISVDLPPLLQELGLGSVDCSVKYNQTKHNNAPCAYDDELIEIIETLYARDLELYRCISLDS